MEQIAEVGPYLPRAGSHLAEALTSVCASAAASFCLWSAKGRNRFEGSPLSDGADAVLKCGEHLPWQKCPAHISGAKKGAPQTQKHED